MLCAAWTPYILHFKETAITSRASMTVKTTYFVKVWDSAAPDCFGIGECALFIGLSAEDDSSYESFLADACRNFGQMPLPELSSVRFGFETALENLALAGGAGFDSAWRRGETGIRINGLIWMGDKRTMARRIREKLDCGFRCVKLKIGGINFEDEVDLLRFIRREYPASEIELRLDANGAFLHQDAVARLNRLSEFDIHSIEQPIRAGQWENMAELCSQSPIPIALDEELIGFHDDMFKQRLLSTIKPQYIILKPSLCGGFDEADRWISQAEKYGIGWWVTSALESDIGLNAIAGWVSRKDNLLPQGLGTGRLYTNNIPSPLALRGDKLWFDTNRSFVYPEMVWRY